jgi:hypothetical protein
MLWYMHGEVVFLVGSTPHKTMVYNEIMGWVGVNDPKEMDYHREILVAAFTGEAAATSVFDLLPMALPLPFNHGMTVGYAISGKIVGEKVIEAWNVFTGAGENSTSGLTLPSSTEWQITWLMAAKRWPSAGDRLGHTTRNHRPAKGQGSCERRPSPATGSSDWRPWTKVSKAMKAGRGTN